MSRLHLIQEKDHLNEVLAPLVGATIVAAQAILDDSDDDYLQVWPVLQLRTTDGRLLQIEVSQDPEGNGPGHLFIGRVK